MSLNRRFENYTANLLPYQKKEEVKRILDSTKNSIYSIENEEEIEEIEQMAKKRLKEIRDKKEKDKIEEDK